ncbi:MAG: sugar phosphate nucleotidyltransferase [bacterium]
MRTVKTAIITAAGLGTRFLPGVKNVPKEMLVMIDKPVIQYLVEECMEAGMEKIIIVVRPGNDTIKDYFFNKSQGLKDFLSEVGKPERFAKVQEMLDYKGIEIVEQYPFLPYGNGSPIYSAKNLLKEGEPFGMLFGDDVVLTSNKGALSQLVDYYLNSECNSVLAVQKVPELELKRYGIIKPKEIFDETSGIFDYLIEKPSNGEAPSDMASFGRMILSYDIFKYLTPDAIGKDDELWLQDANAKLAKIAPCHYKVIDGKWMTTGDPIRFFEAQLQYFLASKEYGDEARKIIDNV